MLCTWTLLLICLVFAATLAMTSGAFGYSLDDPYIHLAMAEEILAGGYGINSGEPSAASSSIVYPYLLAGLLLLGAGQYAPLIVTSVASLGSAALVAAAFGAAGMSAPQKPFDRAIVLPAAGILIGNVAGLVFTGMEHSLQVAMTLAAVLGVVRFAERGRPDGWWIAVLIAQGLVRYEGLGVAAAGALVLAVGGRPGLGAGVLSAAAAIPAIFAVWLQTLGLPPFPSSVLVKGAEVTGAEGLAGKALALLNNFIENISDPPGLILLVLAVMFSFAAAGGLRGRPRPGVKPAAEAPLVALFVAVILVAHLLAGRFGWAQRYEAYVFIAALTALPVVFRSRADAILSGRDAPVLALTILTVLMAFSPNVRATLESAEGSRNIHLQQHQMHRLAADYVQAPVAVNDLGWVSYRNPNYVLDLWGLGSERARRARAEEAGIGWMAELSKEKGVRLVMIYDRWIEEKPPEWVRLGVLTFRGKLITPSERDVALYATQAEDIPELMGDIRRWAVTLPGRASFEPEAAFWPAETLN